MKTNPLDQLKGICEQLLFRVANLHKSFKHFFVETMICYLSISGRINFSQMARFGQSCEAASATTSGSATSTTDRERTGRADRALSPSACSSGPWPLIL